MIGSIYGNTRGGIVFLSKKLDIVLMEESDKFVNQIMADDACWLQIVNVITFFSVRVKL